MKHGNTKSLQRGVALVLSLLILLVLTVIGVAAMNSTIMQERMAGNARTQAEVFERSSEGVTRSLELFYNNAGGFTFGPYNLSCGQVFGNTLSNQNAEAWSFPAGGGWHLASGVDDNPRLEQRMYCCRSWENVDDGSGTGNTFWAEHPSKLYALNRATFMGGADNTQSLALREVEVVMAEAEPDNPTCAICVPGNMGTVSGPNSGSLNVSGSCGAAVVTDQATDPDAAATFIAGIGHAAIGNFDGGIIGGEMSEPWNNPASLAEFVFWVKLGLPLGSSAADAGVGDSNVRGLYIDGDHGATGGPAITYGTTANPQITYIDGDASFGGNVSGAGIMITRGSLSWNGTPKFNGLLVSLGGGYIIAGGGGGGNPSGSMVITELNYSNPPYPNDPLYGPYVLHYDVARDDAAEEVKMYIPDDFLGGHEVRRARPGGEIAGSEISQRHVPVRPVLLANDLVAGGTKRLIHYFDPGLSDHRFFYYEAGIGHSKGDEFDGDWSIDANGNFVFLDIDGNQIMTLPRSSDPTRDAYGRLIPDFVQVDNYPDDYGYRPNDWGWDAALADAQFEWGSTDFTWSGGGNQNFTYDCRALQQAKHRLLCAQPLQALPTDPNDDFYKDPDSQYGDYCWHSVAGRPLTDGGAVDGRYFEEYATPPSADDRPENQKAWHMWSPSCDCLGISVDADMVITGWRENLGWRDDDDFLGCSGLPSQSGN